jgi:hypothetical protein
VTRIEDIKVDGLPDLSVAQGGLSPVSGPVVTSRPSWLH